MAGGRVYRQIVVDDRGGFEAANPVGRIRTPDQRLRVFISSTLIEMSAARAAVRRAVERLRLSPVMFELGARPHPPQDIYRAYLAQSDIFVGIYGESYGWVAPDADISGLEDELRLSAGMPRLLYVREPAADREEQLTRMLSDVAAADTTLVMPFADEAELESLVLSDIALLLAERFSSAADVHHEPVAPDRSELPEPANPLIGRTEEVARLRRWLEADDVRLVTITGPGGVGKSRLALEAARVVADHFHDGVATVLLDSVREPSLVLPTIAGRALALVGGPHEAQNALHTLHGLLADKRLLLVVDNFEHVLDAAPDVAAVLEACPGVTMLVTSRAALRLRAEREIALGPLDVADDASDGGDAATLRASPAVALFLARATAMNPRFDPDEEALRVIAEICRRLDGLPLAIELAAARIRLLPPQRLLDRLQRRFSVLTSAAADMPDRHQTLRATIDWGFDLLDDAEQIALRRLAAFSGGWTLAAAEAVLTGAGPLGGEVLDVLDGLITKSFVKRPDEDGPTPRFGLLETIREYAGERLLASDDLAATVDAHAAHFLSFAEHAATQLQGPDQTTWLAALEADHDNLRAALRRLDTPEDTERSLRLTVALGRLWLVHAHIHDARRWLTAGMARSAGRRDLLRADLLTWGGWLTLFIDGDVDAAEAISREALGIRRELDDPHGEAVELLALGNVAVYRGDAAEAQRQYEAASQLADATGDDEIRGRALSNLGVVARARGDLDVARDCFTSALDFARPRGDDQLEVLATIGLAGIALHRGLLDEATRLAQMAVSTAVEVGDNTTLAEALEERAAIWAAQGRTLDAAWLWGAAIALRTAMSAARSKLEMAEYDEHVAAARRHAAEECAQDAFTAAWQAGAAAGRAAAVRAALEAAGQAHPD